MQQTLTSDRLVWIARCRPSLRLAQITPTYVPHLWRIKLLGRVIKRTVSGFDVYGVQRNCLDFDEYIKPSWSW